jgi:hypothetical protein
MKTKVLAIVLTFAFLGPSAFTAAKADFSGTWALDKARSEGLPPDMDQTLTIKQTDDHVDVEAKLSGGPGEQTVNDSYFLDGKARDFKPALVGGGTGKGRRTSAWTAVGDGFDATEEATVEGPEGAETIKAARRWRLSPDGRTLTIEMSFEGPNGAVKSKRVFTRK